MARPLTGVNLGEGLLADLARINVRYLLEWHRNGRLYRALSLPLPPRTISFEQVAPHIITYTLGTSPVREFGQYKRRTVTIEGSSGYDARVGYTRTGAITSALGPSLLIEFRKFLEEYQTALTFDEDGAHGLIFRALDEDYHLDVEVSSFNVSRDANGDHFAPAWELILDSYAEAEEDRPFNELQSGIEAVTGAIQQIGAYIAVGAAIVNGSNKLARLFLAPLEALSTITNALSETVDGLRDILDIPSDLLNRTSNAARSFRQTAERLKGDLVRFPDNLSNDFLNLGRLIGVAEGIEHEAIRAASYKDRVRLEETEFVTAPPNIEESQATRSQALTAYRLRLGEDLRTLAARLFNDGSRWVELAEVNGWMSERLTGSGRPFRAGDIILIPSIGAVNDVETLNSVGADLQLTDGQLVLKGDDLVIVESIANIEQAVLLRTSAINGETPILPNYGLPPQTGRRVSATSAGYLGAHVREQIAKDQRILSVPVIEVEDKGDALNVSVQFRSSFSGLLTTNIRVNG